MNNHLLHDDVREQVLYLVFQELKLVLAMVGRMNQSPREKLHGCGPKITMTRVVIGDSEPIPCVVKVLSCVKSF